MNNKQPKPQEIKQQPVKQPQMSKQQQMSKQNNPVLKQTQPKMTQPKTSAFKPDKKIEKYANSNQFRVDHTHDFDNDYEQEFGMSAPEKKLMSNKVIRDAVVDSNVKGNNTGIKNLLDNHFDEVSDEELLNDNDLWKDDNSPIVDFNDERWQQAADDMLSDISWKYQTRNRDKEETIDLAGSDLMREYGLNYEDAMRLATEAFNRRYEDNSQSLELKHKQLEELIPEDKREQTKLLLDYFVNDLGIDEETALDSIIESAKKVKKL